ncbi:MAG: hypothetical protein F6K11_30655 [Leptolyngbya sp. SIO3F4]|nr:hypothetical protein [Leptolyngbya sp. SIO3F4]
MKLDSSEINGFSDVSAHSSAEQTHRLFHLDENALAIAPSNFVVERSQL